MHKQREKAKDTQALRNRLIQDQVGLVSFYDVDTPSESKTDSHNGFVVSSLLSDFTGFGYLGKGN